MNQKKRLIIGISGATGAIYGVRMALFQQLNTGQGITIILVTHEADIAAYARRQIIFRDGLVISDRVSEQVIAKMEH